MGIAPFVMPVNVVVPTINNGFAKVRKYFNPNDDPQLHESVVHHFYKKLKTIWFETSFTKLLRFVKIENGTPSIVNNESEIKDSNEHSQNIKKVEYILEHVFTKYDMEALLQQVAYENMANWYDMKTKHNHIVKEAVYKKIKHRLTRHL
jgi:hypothetical protein